MREGDNVAIVANDRGLPAGARIPDGPTLREAIPQGHKVALCDIPEDGAIVRYGVVTGHATRPLPAGSWVYEAVMRMPPAPSLDALPICTAPVPDLEPLSGHTFQGYRNADGSVGTRNILAIAMTVQCVAGVDDIVLDSLRSDVLLCNPLF